VTTSLDVRLIGLWLENNLFIMSELAVQLKKEIKDSLTSRQGSSSQPSRQGTQNVRCLHRKTGKKGEKGTNLSF